MKAAKVDLYKINDLWNLIGILFIIMNHMTVIATVYLLNLSMPIGNSKSSLSISFKENGNVANECVLVLSCVFVYAYFYKETYNM